VKAGQIETRHIDFGVGVLRGVLSRPELSGLLTPQEIEASIEHTRAAARLVERLQRGTAREKRTKKTARHRATRRT